jgi:DNA-binding CsgD family transcriptional regulator
MTDDTRLDRGLTARERQVLELVGAGVRDDDIADRLQIAPTTVAMLLRSSMAKLDARTRVEAAARSRGIGAGRVCQHEIEGG